MNFVKPARYEQVGENIHHVIRAKAVAHAQRQTFPGVSLCGSCW